jgi:choline dehydrogenase-like flavoprotein
MTGFDYDVLIIGPGFGGSVTALRAAEGYRAGVMEAGRRWPDNDIPKTQWDLPGFLWFPGAELYGAGVGGGSHVYANTLYVPPRKFFDAPEWAGITDWAGELAPYLDQARRMLGVVRYPYLPTDVDRYMRAVATEMGREETVNRPRADGPRRHRVHQRHGSRAGRPARLLHRQLSRPADHADPASHRPQAHPGILGASGRGRHARLGGRGHRGDRHIPNEPGRVPQRVLHPVGCQPASRPAGTAAHVRPDRGPGHGHHVGNPPGPVRRGLRLGHPPSRPTAAAKRHRGYRYSWRTATATR